MLLKLARDELGRADVQALLAMHGAALRAAAPPGGCHVLGVDGLSDPAITFFSARDGEDRLLGVAALKALPAGEGEVKSMRVDPSATRQGAGAFLLEALMAEARARGYRTIRLETGRDPLFEAAIALYRRTGFVETGRFGDYPDHPYKLFMALPL
jgi:putative acetyltransferase